ncbi:MAG TPA: tyrosine-type recombinase/integrase [Thermoanaerobaculia bacterium]|nr:tyrosine-type recombinase/integrase [Thermoanaerobaculia bacterium]
MVQRRRLTLDEAVAQFLSGYFATNERSPKTVTAYTLDLAQFRAFARSKKRLSSVRPELIEEWAAALKGRGYKTASIRRKLASVRCFFAYWVRRRVIQYSPMSGLKIELAASRVLPNFLSLEEVSAILREAVRLREQRDDFLSIRNLAIIETMFATGMRVGELVSLRLSDLRLAERSVLIHGKGRRERLAFFVEPVSFTRIACYVTSRPSTSSDALFTNPSGAALSTQAVANIIRGLCSHAGITRRVTPHTFRHTVATLLLRNGADLRVVQELLGHASITMTQRYTHVVKEQMREALERAHPRVGMSEMGQM